MKENLLNTQAGAGEIEILERDEALEEIRKLLESDPQTHVVVQARLFVAGEKSLEFYKAFSSREGRTFINVDSNSSESFQRDFSPNHDGKPLHTIRFTHDRYTKNSLLRPFVGRNHVRLIIVGETAFVSAFDFHEGSFLRSEIFIKVNQSELVQMLKIFAFWDYSLPKSSWRQKTNNLELILDTGKKSEPVISKYAEDELKKRITPNSKIWFTASWYPDQLLSALNLAAQKGAEINLLIDKQWGAKDFRDMMATTTKIASNWIFRFSTDIDRYNVYYTNGNEIHAKFLLIQNGIDYWWLVGTSNHTRFGNFAKTTELGISGSDTQVGSKLVDYFNKELKIRVK